MHSKLSMIHLSRFKESQRLCLSL